MLFADYQMAQCHTVFCAWMTVYCESIPSHSIQQPHCEVWYDSYLSFAERNSSWWQLREFMLYFWRMILMTRGDEMESYGPKQYLQDGEVWISDGVIWNRKYASLTTVIVPDIFHPIWLVMFKHLMDWVTYFLQQHFRIDIFTQLCVMMSQYLGFAWFNKPWSLVMQRSGEEIRASECAIVPIIVACLSNPLPRLQNFLHRSSVVTQEMSLYSP